MMNEERKTQERRKSSCTIYTLSTPLANIIFIKTRQLKQEQRRKKKKESHRIIVVIQLLYHSMKANEEKEILEKEQRKAREYSIRQSICRVSHRGSSSGR